MLMPWSAAVGCSETSSFHAERSGAVGGDALAGLALEALDLELVGVAERLGRDLHVADLGDRGAHAAPEDVVDAPDREADDQEAEQDGDDDLAEPALPRLAKALHHDDGTRALVCLDPGG